MLVESELRGLMRNALERIVAVYLGKRSNKTRQLLLQLATRIVASVVAVSMFRHVNKIKHIHTTLTLVGVAVVLTEAFLTHKNSSQ